ncbi:MAG: NAD(P)-binding protein, partial [Clostridiales bacterium]|nr:NAD(P)-binding protein [Clostridiales bacterium]
MNGKNDKLRQEDTTKITERCFYGEPASCSHGCPFFFDIRTFLTRARDGKWGLAYKLLRNATIFPGIVCEICPAPCENECQRALVLGDGAIAVREIEAACVRSAKDKRPESYHIPPKTQRIAVIGAGLFGLSAALNLAQKAYPVTVFERGNGALAAHLAHPLYERFSEEVALQFSGVADRVEWRFGVSVSGTDDPALAGYDAVVFAAGENGAGAGVWDASSIVFEKTSTGAGKAGNDAKACGGWTNTGRFFCGGALTGQDAMESIAYGIEVSKGIERWLMTGDREAGDSPARPEKHYLAHTGAGSAPRVLAASEGYTADEAMREAARCLFCDCRACFEVCEMLTKYNKRPQKIAIEAYTDTKAAPPFSACSLTRETYSCNLCGKCKEVCPVDVDQEKLFFMAREGRAETGKHPRAFHDFWLRDMAWHTDEEKGGAYFAAGTNYLFFPGCKLGSRAPQQVEGAALLLKERFGAGVLLSC